MTFHELELDSDLQRGIDDAGFEHCTEVQEKTFEHTLGKRDVTVQSQTGTGKTAAFLITIYQLQRTDPDYKDTAALVVAPTRELAVQIENDATMLGKHLNARIACIYGGVGYKHQEEALAAGVDIVVATPGRLLDLNQSKKLDFRMFKIAVIDEADRLFDMGFYPDIRRIFRKLPPKEERITMLYSATLGTRVLNISWEYMNNPVEIKVASERMTVDEVEQQVFHVSKNEKFSLLLGLLKEEEPESSLIFANTKSMCEELAYRLRENGYKAQYIIGDLPQKKRLKIIDDLKKGKTNLLVATDVAARGLHVNDLDLVINYDLPEDPESYVHRIGRTARAGKKGRAISLACERFVYSLEPIQEFIDMKIPPIHPGDADFGEDASRGRSLSQLRRAHTGSAESRSGRMRRSSGGDDDGRGPRSGSRPRHGGGGRASDAREKTRHSGEKERVGAGSQKQSKPGGPRHGGNHGGRHPGSAGRDGGHGNHGRTRRRDDAEKHDRATNRDEAPVQASAQASAGGGKNRSNDQSDSRPSSGSSPEARLEYYRRKYGEDFEFAEGGGGGRGAGGGNRPGSGTRDGGPSQGGSNRAGGARSGGPSQGGTRAEGGKSGAPRREEPADRPDKSAHGDASSEKKSGVLGRIKKIFGGD
mgnify:CR=1 FL=1